jgi:hypothetical protein
VICPGGDRTLAAAAASRSFHIAATEGSHRPTTSAAKQGGGGALPPPFASVGAKPMRGPHRFELGTEHRQASLQWLDLTASGSGPCLAGRRQAVVP